MTDRELLEAAAKAVGMEVWFPRMNGGKGENGERIILTPCHTEKTGKTVEWSPLTDDGDALRLAVKLKMLVDCDDDPSNPDRYAAIRRAIVRAAAMKGKP